MPYRTIKLALTKAQIETWKAKPIVQSHDDYTASVNNHRTLRLSEVGFDSEELIGVKLREECIVTDDLIQNCRDKDELQRHINDTINGRIEEHWKPNVKRKVEVFYPEADE